MRSAILAAMVIATFTIAPAVGAGGGGACQQSQSSATEPATIIMSHNCFGPEVLEVSPGSTVTFRNDDPNAHTVTGAGLQWGSVDLMNAGATVDVTFDEPGVFPFMCILHPGMAGAVVVVDEPTETAAAGASTASEGSPPIDVAIGALLFVSVIGSALLLARRIDRRPRLVEPSTGEPVL